MINKFIYKTFKNASKTYFYSSIFFTKEVKKDVFDFYAFVRLTDDFVDQISQDYIGYYLFKYTFYQKLNRINYQKIDSNFNLNHIKIPSEYLSEVKKSFDENKINNNHLVVIEQFVNVMIKRNIQLGWVESFFTSMQMDIVNKKGESKKYLKMNDTLEYIYGSAEVIGLIMAKILNLPEQSYLSAKYLGRAMQYANFIRDIDEDTKLNRCYFSAQELKKHNLSSLAYNDTFEFKKNFKNFVLDQINYYEQWQNQAEQGYKYINKRHLIPVKTAGDMYKYTIKTIKKDPLIIYSKKVKPSIRLIIFTIIKNFLTIK